MRAILFLVAAAALAQRPEAELLKVLQSSATAAAKDLALRELSLIGTEASVPALARMLTTSGMARYALARIPGPAADDALRAALAKSSGLARIGIINSLGQRRDAKSVGVLRPLLLSQESGVAEAAAAALGEIGGATALAALAEARSKVTGDLRRRLTEAYLECASRNKAIRVYKELVADEEPERIRIAAMGRLAAEDPAAAISVLTAALDSHSPTVQSVAIRMLSGIPAKQVTAVLIEKFARFEPPAQVRLLTALADRGDTAARPLLMTAAMNRNNDVRIAAFAGLGKLGDSSSVAVLAEAASGQPAAREALSALRGPGIDEAIIRAMSSATGKVKVELIIVAGDRGITAASDLLSQAVQEKDPDVHREALRALRNVAGPAQVPALLDLLIQATTASDRREVTQTLASVLKRSGSSRVDAVISTYKSASIVLPVRVALLEVMGQTSSDEALPLLRAALTDSTPEIARGAILALSDWANPAPMPDLLTIARSETNPTLQVLALRGYLKLIALPSQRPAVEGAKMLSEAMRLAMQAAEKRTVLSLLSTFPCTESLQIAQTAMKGQDIAKEAAAAVERINGLIKFR